MADMDRNEYNGGMENMPETDGSKRPETGTDRQEDGWTSYESGQGSPVSYTHLTLPTIA